MKMKRGYDKMEDVPEAQKEFYIEKDGKAVLDGIEGMDVFALAEQVATRDETIKQTTKERDEALADKTKIETDMEALKKEKGSKDNSVEMAELRRNLEEATKRAETAETSVKETNSKLQRTAIEKEVQTAILELADSDPIVQADILKALTPDFVLTEDGRTLTDQKLGDKGFMKPADYVADYLKDRPKLAKVATKDNINNKDKFSFDKKTSKNEPFDMDSAPSIGDAMHELWGSE